MGDNDISENMDIESLFSIKVLHISDNDSSKTFGELLKTKSSRSLMQALKKKQMYVNQMHKEQEMRVSLVTHHLNKLIELDFLNIVEKPISKKTKDHRYFDLKHDAYIVLIDKEEDVEEVQEYSILKKIFTDSVKLSCIGIAGLVAWFSSASFASYSRFDELHFSLTVTGIIVGIGLSLFHYSKKHK
jgi:hypothetical protein